MTGPLGELSIREIGRALRVGTLTSEALTRRTLDEIALVDPVLHLFVTITPERAIADAQRADSELRAERDRGLFHGIPYGLKDLYDTKGILTTCQSKILKDNVPTADSTVARKLADAGGVLLGKLTTHEFAHGGPSFDLPWPPARNPWNPDHFAGGSSSGSAAAVASGIMRMAMGSDTGGSIRGPAALCGAFGLKPTYGRVSRHGVFPLAYSLDHTGPIARSAEDAAIALQVTAGYDPNDPASSTEPVGDYLSGLDDGVAGLRIGVPRHYFTGERGAKPDMLAAIDRTIVGLRAAGAIVEDITLPDYRLFAACGQIILCAEGYAVHEENMRTRPQDYGDLTMRKTIIGATVTGAEVVQANRVRRYLCGEMNAVFERYDAVLTAGPMSTAVRIDQAKEPSWVARQNITFNVTGTPAMSIPTGLGDSGLPTSLTVGTRAFDEALLLRIGRAIETITGWEKIRPQVETLPWRAALSRRTKH